MSIEENALGQQYSTTFQVKAESGVTLIAQDPPSHNYPIRGGDIESKTECDKIEN
jgi:hypothetical protein